MMSQVNRSHKLLPVKNPPPDRQWNMEQSNLIHHSVPLFFPDKDSSFTGLCVLAYPMMHLEPGVNTPDSDDVRTKWTSIIPITPTSKYTTSLCHILTCSCINHYWVALTYLAPPMILCIMQETRVTEHNASPRPTFARCFINSQEHVSQTPLSSHPCFQATKYSIPIFRNPGGFLHLQGSWLILNG